MLMVSCFTDQSLLPSYCYYFMIESVSIVLHKALFLLHLQKPGGFDIQQGILGEMNSIELVICMIWQYTSLQTRDVSVYIPCLFCDKYTDISLNNI